jgi:DNA repair protein SbcC/Rad50
MKILKLTICNLASIAGEAIIDFTAEPLVNAGLFAITGPTGSGKSTILDAICLALYGNTPRLAATTNKTVKIADSSGEEIGQNSAKNILRKNCTHGFAILEFIGVDKKKYEAKWEIRRSFNKINGKMKDAILVLKNLTDDVEFGAKKEETAKEIVRVVGLTFSQFCKSVLLAQGEFTTFLKADEGEKAELLEKLTGTEIYKTISANIFAKAREEKEIVTQLQKELGVYTPLGEDEIQQLLLESIDNKNGVKLNAHTIQLLETKKTWHSDNNRLIQEVESVNAELHSIVANIDLQKEDALTLEMIDKLSPLKIKLDEQKNLNAKRDEGKKDFENLQMQKKLEVEKLEKIKADKIKFETEKIIFDKEYDDNKPKITEAKLIDRKIKDDIKNKAEQEEKVNIKLKETENCKLAIADLVSNGEQIISKQNELDNWFVEYDNKKSIALNIDVILNELQQLQRHKTKIKELQIGREVQEDDKQTYTQKIQKLEKNIDTFTQSIYEKEKIIAQLNSELIKNDANALNELLRIEDKKSGEISKMIEAINTIESIKSEIVKTKEEIERLIVAIQNGQITIDKTNAAIEKNNALQGNEEKHIADLEKLHGTAVVALRANLVAGEPCAVCGSVEHFYKANEMQTNQFLDAAKKVLHQLQTEAIDLQKNYQLNIKQLIMATSQLGITEQQFEKMQKDVAEKQNNLDILNKILNVDVANFDTATKAHHHVKNDIQILSNKLEDIKKIQVKYDQNGKDLQSEKDQKQKSESELAVIKNSLKNNLETLQISEKVFEQEHIEIISWRNKLSHYFTNEKWEENFDKNNNDFLEGIQQFAKKWQSQINDLEKLAKNKLANIAELHTEQEKLNIYQKDLLQQNELLEKLIKELLQLDSKRKKLFEGKDILQIEVTFEAKQKENAVIEKKLDQQSNEVQQSLAIIIDRMSSNEKLIKEINKKVERIVAEIQDWVIAFNNSNTVKIALENVENYFAYSSLWIAETKKLHQQTNEKLTSITALVNERKSKWEQHKSKKNGEESLEMIEELLKQEQLLKDALQEINTKLAVQKKQHDDAVLKSKDIMQKIEIQKPISELWNKLNDLIGSSDGKKFSIVAQHYTLDYLLQYANMQLRNLAKRYTLSRIPESLALQICDGDMGNEVRSVHSLSGGESFMVSLALALGLASLSSNKMQIESLFIDEGFGSLDSNTLGVVMDALEKLQSQGRKVGVISHVQEMTERIATQIHVKKASSGKSVIEVGNFYR